MADYVAQVELVPTTYGTPSPRIELCGPSVVARSRDHRALAAVVYRLAAAVEEASTGFNWTVTPDVDSGRIVIELVQPTRIAVEQALSVLREVAEVFNARS